MDILTWEILKTGSNICHIDEIPSLIANAKFATARKKSGNIRYLNIPISFDIEVSSFYDGIDKRAVMYAWVFCVDGHIIFGREWHEAIYAFKVLSDALNDMNDKDWECRAIV